MALIRLVVNLLPLLSTALTFHFSTPPSSSQRPLANQPVRPIIRSATVSDIDDITNILVDAFAPAPEQDYVFQFRDKYPAYHWECMRQGVVEIIDQVLKDELIYFNVIDAPVSGDEDEMKAVAVAGWVLMTRNNRTSTRISSAPQLSLPFSLPLLSSTTDNNCSLHLDMNVTRARHFSSELEPYEKHYIVDAYEKQVYLAILATHPDYDGRGFGAAHCEWGKELARQWEKDLSRGTGKEKKVNVTLMATPRGYELYSTIGFENIANLSFTRVDGDKPSELTWQEVMVYQS